MRLCLTADSRRNVRRRLRLRGERHRQNILFAAHTVPPYPYGADRHTLVRYCPISPTVQWGCGLIDAQALFALPARLPRTSRRQPANSVVQTPLTSSHRGSPQWRALRADGGDGTLRRRRRECYRYLQPGEFGRLADARLTTAPDRSSPTRARGPLAPAQAPAARGRL